MDSFCYLYFMFIFVMLSCLFFSALWPPTGKELTSCFSCVLYLVLHFCHFPMWCSGSGGAISMHGEKCYQVHTETTTAVATSK